MESEEGEDLATLLESTLNLSEGLETLYSEHEVLLEALKEKAEGERGNEEGGARRGKTEQLMQPKKLSEGLVCFLLFLSWQPTLYQGLRRVRSMVSSATI